MCRSANWNGGATCFARTVSSLARPFSLVSSAFQRARRVMSPYHGACLAAPSRIAADSEISGELHDTFPEGGSIHDQFRPLSRDRGSFGAANPFVRLQTREASVSCTSDVDDVTFIIYIHNPHNLSVSRATSLPLYYPLLLR